MPYNAESDDCGLLPLRKRIDESRLFPLDLVEQKWEARGFYGALDAYRDWRDMPSFEMSDTDSVRRIVVHFRRPAHKIVVHFRSREDIARFGNMLGYNFSKRDIALFGEVSGVKVAPEVPGDLNYDHSIEEFASRLGSEVWTNGNGSKLTEQTDSMWFGGREDAYFPPRELLWSSDRVQLPRYPVYVPSVGRWDDPRTSRALEALSVPHRVVVEPAQRDDYAHVLGADRLLVLPEDYSVDNAGSIPARNFIWEHSLAEGHTRHWVLDDNIKGFLRMHRNRRIPVSDGAVFCAAEDFTDRYENVAFSGFNYMYLVKDRQDYWPPFFLNNRVYSMILVNNLLPYRWRGHYNEDTDICLRALKDGWCTVLFNAFLGDKAPTLTMGGGNTDTVYATGDNRRAFAESLVEQHPDVARVVWRYERWHHEVDYSGFRRNKLIPREGIVPPADPEYGMKIVHTPGRSSRYPRPQQPEYTGGDIEDGVAGGHQEGSAGGIEKGNLRSGAPGSVRPGQGGGVQRRRGDHAPPAWRP